MEKKEHKFETIKGTVCRGFINRFLKEEEWIEELVILPQHVNLIDGDAIPYYLKAEDGKFYEYYGNKAPEGMNAYIALENFQEKNFK